MKPALVHRDLKPEKVIPSRRHESRVDRLCRAGAQRTGFAAFLRTLDIHSPGFVPDAFIVDREERHLVLYEVVVTHAITPEKFARLRDLDFVLDCVRWSLSVFSADQSYAMPCRLDLNAEGPAREELERVRVMMNRIARGVGRPCRTGAGP